MISIASGKHILTSIEDLHQDGFLRLCSTNQIFWMDPRMPGKQILAYCHGRQYDRYLATETSNGNSNKGRIGIQHELHINIWKTLAFTLLKSRNNGLVTVYDVSRSQSNLVFVNAAPYALSNGTGLYGKYDGHGILGHNHRSGLVRLSERGGLIYNALAFNSSEEYTPVVEWTTALQELKTTTATFCSDAGPLDFQDRPHVDLGPVYYGKKNSREFPVRFLMNSAQLCFVHATKTPRYSKNRHQTQRLIWSKTFRLTGRREICQSNMS